MGIVKELIKKDILLDKKINNKGKIDGCIRQDILANRYNVVKRIGTSSINGEVYLANLKNNEIVIKKTPLLYNFFKNYKKKFNLKTIEDNTFITEVFFLYICKFLMKKMITPNLPFMYSFMICKEKCSFNEKVLKEYGGDPYGCGFLLVEKAENDLKNFLLYYKPTYLDIMVAYYHIFSGLTILKHYTNFLHGDLHYGNVLFKKIDPQKGYIEYIYKKEKHLIPNIGYMFFIWDFGSCRIPGLFGNPGYDNAFKDYYSIDDYINIVNNLGNTGVQFQAKSDLQDIIIKSVKIENILHHLHEKIKKINQDTSKSKKILDRFRFSKPSENIIYKAYTKLSKVL